MSDETPQETLPAVRQGTVIPGLYGSALEPHAVPTMAGAIRSLCLRPDANWTYCSIPKEELQGIQAAARFGRLRRGAARELKTLANTVIEVQHIIVTPGKFLETNGEVMGRVPRILLVAPDDSVVSCGAESILDWIDELISFGCPPPWNPPLRCMVHVKPIDGGKQVYVLEILDNAATKPDGATRAKR